MFDMPEDLTSEDAYFKAIQECRAAEERRDRAYQWQAAAGNPISRLVSNVVVRNRDRQYYDSEEHVGLIEELRQLDAAHARPDTTSPASELPPDLFDI